EHADQALEVRLSDLVQAEARQVCVPQLEDTWSEGEEGSIAAHVPDLGERAQEAARRGARQPGRPRHLTQGELGMLRIERADDGEPSLQGLHEIGADAPVD